MLETVALVFSLAILLGLVTTYLGRATADRVGLRDRPDGRRKLQTKPVAVVGGLALLAAVPAALLVAAAVSPAVATAFAGHADRWLSVAAAAALLAVVGVLDDVTNLRARYKLLGQLSAVAILIVGGDFLVREVSVFGVEIPLGLFAVPFTVAWFVFAINALNLLDGMDGMLGAVGIALFVGLASMAAVTGSGPALFVSVAAVGGLIGFLRYNLPPASVYLGDCGSMLIGLTAAVLAVDATLKGPTFAVLAPLSLMVLPLLDTTAAVVRRKLTGRGLAIGDRGHLHHVLLRCGYSIPRVLLIVGALGGAAAGGAVASVAWRSDAIAVLTVAFVAVTLLVCGLFGAAELRLIRARAGSVLRKVAGGRAVELEVRLQGTHGWGAVWERIVHDARSLNLTSVCLDVNAPAWHEGYHRRWAQGAGAEDPLHVWRVELPLLVHGQLVGRLTVSGERADGCMAEKLAALSAVVRSTEALLSAAPPDGVHPAVAAVPASGTLAVPPQPVAKGSGNSNPPTPLPA